MQSSGGKSDANGVHTDAYDHEWDAIVDEEGGGASCPDERGEVGNVVRAASDHSCSRGTHTGTSGRSGSTLESVAVPQFAHETDLHAKATDNRGEEVPVLGGLFDDVVERTRGGPDDDDIEQREPEAGHYPGAQTAAAHRSPWLLFLDDAGGAGGAE